MKSRLIAEKAEIGNDERAFFERQSNVSAACRDP
jgi:hypothetical protein